MGILNNLKIWALIHATNNMSDSKIVDMIVDYQVKEFGKQSSRAIEITADKLMRIALELYKRKD